MSTPPPSLRDIGLNVYLDRTRDQHNGLGWSEFKTRMDMGVSKARIARDFGMSRVQVYHWIELYKEL